MSTNSEQMEKFNHEFGNKNSLSIKFNSFYMEINNFYTLTVYEKGAEVVGMIHSLLGDQKFREGS